MGSPPEVLVMGAIHGLVAVSWMGVHIGIQLFLLPDIKKATKLADLPGLRSLARVSKAGTILGILTVVTGLLFFFIKWGFDVSAYTADYEARTVLIALAVVLAVIVMGFTVLKPTAMGIGKRAASMNPMEPFPEDFKADVMKLAKFLNMSRGLVFLAFLLMIVAINGGF